MPSALSPRLNFWSPESPLLRCSPWLVAGLLGNNPRASSGSAADAIHQGDNIITKNNAQPAAEALALKDGKMLTVRSKAEVLKTKGGTIKITYS
jgi:aspartate 1-decarboxylase